MYNWMMYNWMMVWICYIGDNIWWPMTNIAAAIFGIHWLHRVQPWMIYRNSTHQQQQQQQQMTSLMQTVNKLLTLHSHTLTQKYVRVARTHTHY